MATSARKSEALEPMWLDFITLSFHCSRVEHALMHTALGIPMPSLGLWSPWNALIISGSGGPALFLTLETFGGFRAELPNRMSQADRWEPRMSQSHCQDTQGDCPTVNFRPCANTDAATLVTSAISHLCVAVLALQTQEVLHLHS